MHLFIIIIIIIIIMTMILITVIFTILLITTSMVVVVMIGDGYGLYDDDHSNDHMIIFYSTKDDWSQLLICYVILISTLLISYPYCTFQALQQVLCLKVDVTNRLR